MREMEACYLMKPHLESQSISRMKSLYNNCSHLTEKEIKVESFVDSSNEKAEFFVSFLKFGDTCKANFNWISQRGEEDAELLTADLTLHPLNQTFCCKEYERRVQNKFFMS